MKVTFSGDISQADLAKLTAALESVRRTNGSEGIVPVHLDNIRIESVVAGNLEIVMEWQVKHVPVSFETYLQREHTKKFVAALIRNPDNTTLTPTDLEWLLQQAKTAPAPLAENHGYALMKADVKKTGVRFLHGELITGSLANKGVVRSGTPFELAALYTSNTLDGRKACITAADEETCVGHNKNYGLYRCARIDTTQSVNAEGLSIPTLVVVDTSIIKLG